MGATTGGIRAGRAFVELYADSTQLLAELRGVEAKFKGLGTMIEGWGTKLTAAGVAVMAPLAALSKLTASMGENFINMSNRTGISVETLSAMDYAASQAGTTLEGFESGIKNMQKSLVGAAEGTAENVGVFEKLGLTVQNLRGMKPDEQFLKIADAMGKVTNPSTRAALAMKIFGKSGTELLPMLKEGQGGLQALIQRATELGIVMSAQDAMAAEQFSDKLSELWRIVRKAGFDIGLVLVPMITTVANAMERVIVPVMAWLKANKALVLWIGLFGAALAAAGVSLFAFGVALIWAMEVAMATSAAISALWGALMALASFSGTIAAVVMNPILLTIAAVLAFGAALLWVSGVGGKVVGWLGSRFSDLQKFASDAFHGISDALLAGDIQLAAQILWKTLEVAWRTGVNVLEGVWLKFKFGFLTVWYSIFDGAKAAWIIFQDWLTTAIIKSTAVIQTIIAKVMGVYARAVAGRANLKALGYIDDQEKSGELTHAQAEMARAAINKMSTDEVGGINATEQGQIALAEKAKNDALAAAKSQNDADLAAAGKSYNDKIETLKQSGLDKTIEGRLQLNRLTEEMGILLREAATARAMTGTGMPNIPNPADLIEGINQAKAASFGTFSAQGAAAAGGVAGASALIVAAQKTATNTDKTAKGVATLVERGGPTFA